MNPEMESLRNLHSKIGTVERLINQLQNKVELSIQQEKADASALFNRVEALEKLESSPNDIKSFSLRDKSTLLESPVNAWIKGKLVTDKDTEFYSKEDVIKASKEICRRIHEDATLVKWQSFYCERSKAIKTIKEVLGIE